MKRVLIGIINLYQKLPISTHSYCRFQPTCSEYAKEAINEYGSIKGSYISIKRILRCNPLSKKIYDPVIKKGDNYEKNN